jgi:hypothetical protein
VQARARSRRKHASTQKLHQGILKMSWRTSVHLSRNWSKGMQRCKTKWPSSVRQCKRKMAEQRASMQAQLEGIESRQPPANLNVLPVAPLAPAAQSNLFKMRDPAPFCGGPAELERFLGGNKMNFESHGHQFPRGDPDKVQYAMRLFRTWLEHPDESQRKSKVTHPAEWAN